MRATGTMPTVNLQTNVPVDSVVTSDILKDASKTVARILGKPESVSVTLPCFFKCLILSGLFVVKHLVFFFGLCMSIFCVFFPRKHEGRSLMPRELEACLFKLL